MSYFFSSLILYLFHFYDINRIRKYEKNWKGIKRIKRNKNNLVKVNQYILIEHYSQSPTPIKFCISKQSRDYFHIFLKPRHRSWWHQWAGAELLYIGSGVGKSSLCERGAVAVVGGGTRQHQSWDIPTSTRNLEIRFGQAPVPVIYSFVKLFAVCLRHTQHWAQINFDFAEILITESKTRVPRSRCQRNLKQSKFWMKPRLRKVMKRHKTVNLAKED